MRYCVDFIAKMHKRVVKELNEGEYDEIYDELHSLESKGHSVRLIHKPGSLCKLSPNSNDKISNELKGLELETCSASGIVCDKLHDFISSLDSKEKRDDFIGKPLIHLMLDETIANKISYDSDGLFEPDRRFKLAYMAYEKMQSCEGGEDLRVASKIAKYSLLFEIATHLTHLLMMLSDDSSDPVSQNRRLITFMDLGVYLDRIDRLSVFSDEKNHTAYRSLFGKLAIESTRNLVRKQYAKRACEEAENLWQKGDTRMHHLIGRELFGKYSKEKDFPSGVTEKFFIRSIKDVADKHHRKSGVKKR